MSGESSNPLTLEKLPFRNEARVAWMDQWTSHTNINALALRLSTNQPCATNKFAVTFFMPNNERQSKGQHAVALERFTYGVRVSLHSPCHKNRQPTVTPARRHITFNLPPSRQSTKYQETQQTHSHIHTGILRTLRIASPSTTKARQSHLPAEVWLSLGI